MATLTLKGNAQSKEPFFSRVVESLAILGSSFITAIEVTKEIDQSNQLSPRGRALLGLQPEK